MPQFEQLRYRPPFDSFLTPASPRWLTDRLQISPYADRHYIVPPLTSTYFLLQERYDYYANLLGLQHPRTQAVAREVRAMQDDLPAPDTAETELIEAKSRIDCDRIAESYLRAASSSIVDYQSSDGSKRQEAFDRLNMPDEAFIGAVCDIFSARCTYMVQTRGSLDAYYREKDGFSWDEILSDSQLTKTITKQGIAYARKRCNSLGIHELTPVDLYAIRGKTPAYEPRANRNDASAYHKYVERRMKNFLYTLGLGEVADALIFLHGKKPSAMLIHSGRNFLPRPVVFHAEKTSRWPPYTLGYEVACAHEAGHAACNWFTSHILPPLYGLASITESGEVLKEIPSHLFEFLYVDPWFAKRYEVSSSDSDLAKRYERIGLVDALQSIEFEYRLYEQAQDGALTAEGIGRLWTKMQSKYYGVVYQGDNAIDHTWQHKYARHFLKPAWLQTRNIIVGCTVAKEIIDQLQTRFGEHWIGSENFDQKFFDTLADLFFLGPFTRPEDIERMLGKDIPTIMKQKIRSNLEQRWISDFSRTSI